MAQSGSAWVTAVKAFADSRYQKECKTATAWSKAFCTAGLHETGKLTFPIRSDGSIPCCDHVVLVEVRRGEDVAGIGEVGEGGELGADGAADGALEHAADPSGDSVLGAEGLDVPRCRQTAHASHLDVDDLAASESDGRLDMGEAERALVEADRRLDPLLQVGVVDEAHPVVGEGLLDHGEPVTIELAKELGIRRRVGGIAVDVEGEVREGRADGLDHAQIPAGPELQLDPRE